MFDACTPWQPTVSTCNAAGSGSRPVPRTYTDSGLCMFEVESLLAWRKDQS
jgi:hypothetical protein